MKTLKTIIVLISLSLSFSNAGAQSNQIYEKLKASLWGDPDFKTTEIPEKWKDESAVILAKSYEYEVKKEFFLNYVYENITLHKRVKLLDKAAINEFSELSFENDYKNTSFWSSYELKDVYFGIKVIKTTGKQNIIDIKDAVVKSIKEGLNKHEYQKIAIPDLEPGDIVDYFYVIKNSYVQQDVKILDPVYYLLVEQYPIVKQKFNVHVLRKMYFNSKSINGAPSLKQTDKEDGTTYSFVDKDREKTDATLWAYPFRIYPTLKFQAFFIRDKVLNMLDFLEFFLKDTKTNNSKTDITHIDDLVKKIYRTQYLFDYSTMQNTKDYLNKNFEKTTPSDTIVKYAYYHMRQNFNLSASSLMLNLSKVLESRKIKHDLVITIPNSMSDISDLILPMELAYLIRVKGKTDYFIGDFTSHSVFKSIKSDYQGNNAYAVSNPNMEDKPKVQKIVIPIDKSDDNMQTMNVDLKFADNGMDSLQVGINKTLSGIFKEDEKSYIITRLKYNEEVTAHLDKAKDKKKEKPKKKSSKELKEEKEKLQLQEQQQKDGEKEMKNSYKNEFEAGEGFRIDSYALKQMGIWESSPDLQYNVSFKLGNFVKRMGSNYVIEMGKFITRQLELSKKDMERKIDIYEPFPRTYVTKITFDIPSGYKVKGMDKFNINFTNATGGFVGTAEIRNGKLVLNVKKFYTHNFEKATEWPKMVEFIEAAFTYTQQNILLEKI